MKKKFLFPSILIVIALVFLSGCMQAPLENTETVAIYKFKKDASIEWASEASGTLTSAADEWADCDTKLKSLIDMAIQFGEMSPSTDEEQKKSLEMMKKMRDKLRCEFSQNKEAGTGVLAISLTLTPQDIDLMKQMSGAETAEDIIKKNEDGSIEANISISEGASPSAFGMTQELKEVRIFVEGEVLEFQPEADAIENGYYVFRSPNELKGEKLHIKYIPMAAGFPLFGELGFETLLIIGIVIAIIIVLILVLWRKKKKKHVTPVGGKPAEIEIPPEQSEKKIIVGEEEKPGEQIVTEKKIGGLGEPIGEKAGPTQGAKEEKIKRLVKLLEPKRNEYTTEEIRKVLGEEGYSAEITDEVIKRLGM